MYLYSIFCLFMSWKRIAKSCLLSVGMLSTCRTAGNPFLPWSSSIKKIGQDWCALRGQRQRTKDAASSEAGMEKGMPLGRVQGPQELAHSCQAVTEKACLCVLHKVINITQHIACSTLWSFITCVELMLPRNPAEKLGSACHWAGAALNTVLPSLLKLC